MPMLLYFWSLGTQEQHHVLVDEAPMPEACRLHSQHLGPLAIVVYCHPALKSTLKGLKTG